MAGLRMKSCLLFIKHKDLGRHTGSNLYIVFFVRNFLNNIHSGSQLTSFVCVVQTQPIIYNKPTRCNSGSIILVVYNKHNTARVASCWFIIYYRLVMHGNSNIKDTAYIVWKIFSISPDKQFSMCVLIYAISFAI